MNSLVRAASCLRVSVVLALAAMFLHAHALVVSFALGYVWPGVVLDLIPVAGSGGLFAPSVESQYLVWLRDDWQLVGYAAGCSDLDVGEVMALVQWHAWGILLAGHNLHTADVQLV